MRSLFFATPDEPREWLRGKDLSVRRLCDGKRSYKKSIRMPILLRSATYVVHPHSHNLSARSNESKKKERRFCVPYFLRLQTSRANGCGGKDLNQRPSGYNCVGFAKAQLGARSGCCSGATFALRQSITRIEIAKKQSKQSRLPF